MVGLRVLLCLVALLVTVLGNIQQQEQEQEVGSGSTANSTLDPKCDFTHDCLHDSECGGGCICRPPRRWLKRVCISPPTQPTCQTGLQCSDDVDCGGVDGCQCRQVRPDRLIKECAATVEDVAIDDIAVDASKQQPQSNPKKPTCQTGLRCSDDVDCGGIDGCHCRQVRPDRLIKECAATLEDLPIDDIAENVSKQHPQSNPKQPTCQTGRQCSDDVDCGGVDGCHCRQVRPDRLIKECAATVEDVPIDDFAIEVSKQQPQANPTCDRTHDCLHDSDCGSGCICRPPRKWLKRVCISPPQACVPGLQCSDDVDCGGGDGCHCRQVSPDKLTKECAQTEVSNQQPKPKCQVGLQCSDDVDCGGGGSCHCRRVRPDWLIKMCAETMENVSTPELIVV